MKLIAKLIVATSLIVSMISSANAAIILNGSTQLQALSISESFADFYGYADKIPASSSTGFEQVDTAVFMLLENSGQFALLGTFGAFNFQGDDFGGNVSLALTNLGIGSLILIDDPREGETVSGNTTSINFDYASNRTDGFIFGLGNGNGVDLLVELSNLTGLSDFVFIDSNGSQQITDTFTLGNFLKSDVAEPNEVPEPSFLFAFALMLLVASRTKLKI